MTKYVLAAALGLAASFCLHAQNAATISIDASHKGAAVDPALHGIFFEEISHGGEGGLYGELIQNRGFEDSRLPPATTLQNGFIVPDKAPHFSIPNNRPSDWKLRWRVTSEWPAWSLQSSADASISLALTKEKPLNEATPASLQVSIRKLAADGRNNLVNEGFWGINAVKGDAYNLSFYARTDQFNGPVIASLQSASGTVLASYKFATIAGAGWKKYSCRMTAAVSDPKAAFVLNFGSTGTVWLDFVSLFPVKTFRNRPNGMRADLAQYLADLKPAFIRWPGGCFVEGINIQSAPSWFTSIGPVEKRTPTYSPWEYWTGNGFGYHEFLQFCEDINSSALYVFNAGVSCDFRSGTYIPDGQVDSVIASVMDGLEYALGPVTSRWGKVRAANGHPKPFPLKYVEVGNEQSGSRYARRYNRFYAAIKKKYPALKLVASMGIGDVNRRTLDSMQSVDIADEHAYKAAGWALRNWDHFDQYKRGSWDMYVGEYATNSGVGSGNLNAALNDAVYIMAMERNGDLVKMSSYAPLFVNENDVDWPVNLIHFDAGHSFARISYYTIRMLNEARPDYNVPVQTQILPSEKKALYKGGIGLATWDTETEYKDIEVIKGGNVVYRSDFGSRAGEWKKVRGTWEVKDSALAQTAQGAQRFAWLPEKTFDTYTLKVKARKLSKATNAFIIPFAVQDDNTMLRAHIGSYVNANAVFESVTNGMSVADLTNQKRLPAPIETGRWYDIMLEVGPDQVDCYLDGKLLMTYTESPKLFSIAGRTRRGELIVKVVNAGADPCNTTLNISGAGVSSQATLTTLKAGNLQAENSFAAPTKYVPQTRPITGMKSGYTLELPAYSISILRLKTEGK